MNIVCIYKTTPQLLYTKLEQPSKIVRIQDFIEASSNLRCVGDGDGIHFDRLNWIVIICFDFAYFLANVITFNDLTKDWVFRLPPSEPVQVAVVCNIQKKL